MHGFATVFLIGRVQFGRAKPGQVPCALLKLTAPVIESELFLVTPKASAGKEMESLIALLKERAAGI